MTLYIPLDPSTVQPNSPPFLVPSPSPGEHLTAVIRAVLKAKRIAVVCGAGISVEAGIPDFRSQDGLFQSLKRDNPKESLSSGKDLFDAAVFKSKQKTALFYRMIARLSSLSAQGRPTTFHRLLRSLDDRGKLLRVYTQNIDALEMKAGLSFGVPVFDEKHLRIKLKGKAKIKAKEAGSGAYNARLGKHKGTRSLASNQPSTSVVDELDTPCAGPSTSPCPPTPADTESALNVIPRCIPLHGTLLTLHCPHCTQSFPLVAPPSHSATLSPPTPPNSSEEDIAAQNSFHAMLAHGMPPPCPSCTSLEETRALVGKRLRGVGKLRPSVVLYGEDHREGEGVGEVVRRDLCGISNAKATPAPAPGPASASASPDKLDNTAASPSKSRVRVGKCPDLLLVVGTSLRVPGTKRIVREFSKAVRPPPPSRLPTPASPPPPPPASERIPAKIQTVYLNFDFPSPAREWEGVFDVWVSGDVQAFARAVEEVSKEEERKEAWERQQQEQQAAKGRGTATPKAAGKCEQDTPQKTHKTKRKACATETTPTTRPAKRRKSDAGLPPTPTSLPKRPEGGRRPPGSAKKWDASSSPSKVRRVILRLPAPPPPSPLPPSSNKPPLKRKLSIPEVVITTTPGMFARRASSALSLSPLTSLSSSFSSLSGATPPPPPPPRSSRSTSQPTPRATIDVWRRNTGGEGQARRVVHAEIERDLEEEEEDEDEDEDEDLPLAVVAARRKGR